MHNEFGDRFDTSAQHYDHKNGIFKNYWDSFTQLAWYENLPIMFDMHPPRKPDHDSMDKASRDALKYDTIKWDKIKSFHSDSNASDKSIQYLWFGHSSCLVQMDGFNILTDPIFSDNSRIIPI